ncbi:MAG: serine protease [Actinomycetota bacterium]|nr:serine protease [Actinomycetota bacterium]
MARVGDRGRPSTAAGLSRDDLATGAGGVTPPSGTPAANGHRRGDPKGPATPPQGLRHRILPRSLVGLAALILAFALGAGFSGVVLYTYYQYHLDQTDSRVNALINGYKKQFSNAEGDLRASANTAKSQIQSQLAPLQQLQADPKTLSRLVRNLSPSLFFVHTQDANGQPSVGTAFVISSNTDQSLLLTSATTVSASQQNPGPPVFVRQGGTDTKVTVRTVDTQYDLALIILPRGRLPVIKVAPASPAPALADKIFALSGQGTAGAAVTQGALTDVSAMGVTENAAIGQAFQGGPLVNADGQVVAIASRTYAPEGFPSDAVWFAPYPQAACSKVLSCPGGSIGASQGTGGP